MNSFRTIARLVRVARQLVCDSGTSGCNLASRGWADLGIGGLVCVSAIRPPELLNRGRKRVGIFARPCLFRKSPTVSRLGVIELPAAGSGPAVPDRPLV